LVYVITGNTHVISRSDCDRLVVDEVVPEAAKLVGAVGAVVSECRLQYLQYNLLLVRKKSLTSSRNRIVFHRDTFLLHPKWQWQEP
jgi:hypothetical protein